MKFFEKKDIINFIAKNRKVKASVTVYDYQKNIYNGNLYILQETPKIKKLVFSSDRYDFIANIDLIQVKQGVFIYKKSGVVVVFDIYKK